MNKKSLEQSGIHFYIPSPKLLVFFNQVCIHLLGTILIAELEIVDILSLQKLYCLFCQLMILEGEEARTTIWLGSAFCLLVHASQNSGGKGDLLAFGITRSISSTCGHWAGINQTVIICALRMTAVLMQRRNNLASKCKPSTAPLIFIGCTRNEAHFLNILGTSSSRTRHKIYFISLRLACAQLLDRMFERRASGISKLISCCSQREKELYA